MEENTEPQMDTDVTSTTEDVPETQEVTGSDGNVEMIIVVEKMDEETDSNDQTEQQPPAVEESNNKTIPEESKPEELVPETVTPTQKFPTKSPVKTPTKSPVKTPTKSPAKSPTKSPAKTPTKSPSKSPATVAEVVTDQNEADIDQVVVVRELHSDTEAEVSCDGQQVELADSPVKEPPPPPIVDQTTSVEELNSKEIKQELIQNAPIKELQIQNSKSTLTKDSLLDENIQVNGTVQCNETIVIEEINNTNLTSNTIDITVEREASNDSQVETMSDTSEKEHNKSISRELKSLINSAKESKIISECTQLTSKTRKSRTALDNSSSSLNSSLLEPGKIQDVRRNSDNSQKSNCSEKSDKTSLKRSMRSQNPEFVSKVKQFLNSVTGKGHKELEEDEEIEEKVSKEKVEPVESPSKAIPPKIKKIEPIVPEKSNKLRSDSFCWRCHWAVEQATNEKQHPPMHCTVCPRSFHFKCLSGTERSKINLEKSWVCPECMIVLQAESSETRSPAMRKISLGMLCDLLRHALERMMDLNGVEPFMQAVDRTAFPDYDKYVVHPMDLSLMKNNIDEGLYGSTEAFMADVQWILHNSIIFNTLQSKLTAGARALVRSSRAEMGEIEACPECYAAAHARRPTWFTDVCSTPHILLWAKLKGFPYWPAKGMSVNSAGMVDVRFFGAHDRAWVPAKDCFLYSEKDPNNFRTKRQDILDSMQEAEQHIRNISRKYGKYVYPPFKTQFDPTKLNEQLKMMIPTFEGEVRSPLKDKTSPSVTKEKSRSNSKSSKSSFNEGDISENEETPVKLRKMADGAEIAKMEEDDSNVDKDVSMDLDAVVTIKDDSQSSTSSVSSRKRRRSELEEAIITIIETSGGNSTISNEKRKRTDNGKTDENKSESQDKEPSSNKKVEDKPQTTEISKPEITEDNKTVDETTKLKDSESSSSTEKNQRVTPIRIALVTKERRHTRNSVSSKEQMGKIITPSKDTEKTTPQRPKSSRIEKAEKTPNAKVASKSEKVDKATPSKADKNEKTQTSKVDKTEKTIANDKTPKDSRSERRRNSRNSRSLNNSTSRSDKTAKNNEKQDNAEKKSDKNSEITSNKEKAKNNNSFRIERETVDVDKSGRIEKPITESQSPKSVKDRLQFDDDTSLAVLARESNKTIIISNNTSGLPTISCVRSLSTTAQITGTTLTKTTTNASTTDMIVEANSDSSIFTPTSTDNVKTMKDAVNKLQRLRNDAEPVVGRVGVRAFARMTSPEKQNKNDDVQVEIKAEPIDLDDADRHMEKMDLMNAFRLRPVNPNPPSSLREVRINKVVVTPLNARKSATQLPELRPKAKKTFPQPKKADDGRSELNSKNSMVYIPIQPPMTQAPVRVPRPMVSGASPAAPTPTPTPAATPTPRVMAPVTSTAVTANSMVNTVTTPLMQSSNTPITSSAVTSSTSVSNTVSVATVPTIHTVPLMTSVNGQWMFSFQPVMSVGAIDNAPSPPIMNGVAERTNPAPLVALPSNVPPAGAAAAQLPGAVVPAAPATVTPLQVNAGPNRMTTENNLPGEPPRLQQRPSQFLLNPLDASTPIGNVPPPSTAGPITAKLNQNAVKLTDFFRNLLEDSLEKVDEPASQLTTLRLQLEQAQWRHKQEISEVKHNHELTLAEMRASFEKEKLRAISEVRRAAQVELEAAVKLAKSKQWCANCSQEAQFYCCWNTSYCDYPCQRAHWSQHYSVCQQRSQDSGNGEVPTSPENRLKPQPDLPKSSSAPSLTVGGKVAVPRTFAQEQTNNQKASIIVSMVEDTSGNQTMKCVGTYKPSPSAQIAPIIINKQLMNNEENANKKVVASSGGYLIVGGTNNSSVVTPARRTHTIQYYT